MNQIEKLKAFAEANGYRLEKINPEYKYKKGMRFRCDYADTSYFVKGGIYTQHINSDELCFSNSKGVNGYIVVCESKFTPVTDELIYEGGARFKRGARYKDGSFLSVHDSYYLTFRKTSNQAGYDLAFYDESELVPYSKITLEPIQPNEDLVGNWLVFDKDYHLPELCFGKDQFVGVNDKGETRLGTATISKFKLVFHV